MKYFITGVGGFVGRYLVEYLQKREPDAVIIGADITPTCNLPVQYYQLDLNNREKTAEILTATAPDYVVHLASISSVGQSWQNPSACFTNNTSIMLNLLDIIAQNKMSARVLAIGSSEEYGAGKMPLHEDMPLNPQNPYAVAKVSQELLCKLYAQSMGVDVVMTRSFNHIGPRQSERFVVPTFMRQLLDIYQNKTDKMSVGNIDVARDFLDVRDVVAAYYAILHQGAKGEVYNVCSGKSYTLRKIIGIAENILHIKAKIEIEQSRLRPNDVMLIVGDNSKLCRELQWRPQYDIEQTINDIIEHMKEK